MVDKKETKKMEEIKKTKTIKKMRITNKHQGSVTKLAVGRAVASYQ